MYRACIVHELYMKLAWGVVLVTNVYVYHPSMDEGALDKYLCLSSIVDEGTLVETNFLHGEGGYFPIACYWIDYGSLIVFVESLWLSLVTFKF